MNSLESQNIQTYLQEIAEKLESGHASVMIGAGFSKNSSEKFPLWNDLGISFYRKLNNREPNGLEHFLNPMKLAGEIKEEFGFQSLFEIIKSNIPDKEHNPSDLHVRLLKLPWKDIFTTNYDTLLERASEQVINYRFDIVRTKHELPFSNNPRIIKLHGCLEHQKELVITDDDYREYPQKFAPFVNTVLQSLIENTLCLIGFSGEDPNFLSWINWILNNLGKENSPKIYLIGKMEINHSKKKWLENRNINVVDLSLIDKIENKSPKEALSYFVDYISNYLKEKDNLNWPIGITNSKNDFSMIIPRILPIWTKQRMQYPNWFILPEKNRNNLWENTLSWIHEIPNVEKLKFPDDFNFIYELNWRIEKCLYPIDGDSIEFYEKITEKYSIDDTKIIALDKNFKLKWIELKLAMLRYYRDKALWEKWESTYYVLKEHEGIFTSELNARWNYEKAIYYLFRLDFEKSLESIKSWKNDDITLFWEVKRGCLLAEFGEIENAVEIIESCLVKMRKKLNLTFVKNDFGLVSMEAYTILLLNYIKLSKSVLERKFNDDNEKKKEENERLDVLKTYKCDPWEELKLFELKLSNRVLSIDNPSIKYGYDIGNVTRTFTYGQDHGIIDAFTFIRFFEEAGIPFGLPGVSSLGKKGFNSALNIISTLSPHLAFITIIRIGDINLTDELFNRYSISKIEKSVINNLGELYIQKLKNAISNLDNKNKKILAEKLCNLMPEIISRLLSKSSIHIKDDFLNVIMDIYISNNKWAFKDLTKVLNRLINSYTEKGLAEKINQFLSFPVLKNENNRIELNFPEPFRFINTVEIEIGDVMINKLVIDDFINKVGSHDLIERSNALLRLSFLYKWNFLNNIQKELLGEKIWSMINFQEKVPKFKFFYKSTFLNLPHPENINPDKLLKEYIVSTNILLQNDERVIHNYNGEFEWPILVYYGSKRINNKKGIVWSFDELVNLFDRLNFWWDHDKKFLLKDDKDEFVSISNEFKLRFKHLVNILSELIIPNLPKNVDKNIKHKIKILIDEMQEYGLPCMKAKIASLIIFPEDIIDIEKLVHEKISDTNIKQVENTFMGIYFNTHAHKLKISVLLSESIFETISENIKWRSQPGLFYASDLFISILNHNTKQLNDKILMNLLLGLKNLLKDTDLTNQNSNIFPLEERIEIRKFAVGLAFELYVYHKKNNKELPETIIAWKDICKNPEEFIEIRKQWKS
jgi:hypothetical protein